MALSARSSLDAADTYPGPRFSIVMRVDETPPELLEAAIASVVGQTFPDWELLVVDDASASAGVRAVLDAAGDPRVQVQRRSSKGGIVAAWRDALDRASGEWVTFLGQDDLLAPEALEVCHERLLGDPECDLLYTDEDR
ncbi:MAG: glycosyltransferase, partial [Acidimicrobiaceae bacterium]|nr:glycosyltransferase [Acidimicrobiaceae bacterium]